MSLAIAEPGPDLLPFAPSETELAMNCRTLLLPALALGLVACKSPEQKPVDRQNQAKLGVYTKDEITTHAKALLAEMKVGNEVEVKVMNRLGELLADPNFAPKLEKPGVNAVGAFVYGGGGVVIRAGGGTLLMDFAGGGQKAEFDAKGWSVGASVGGDNNYGVVLMVGLEYEEAFPDNYRLQGTGGSLAESGYLVGNGTPERTNPHSMHFVGTTIGFSGTAPATGRLTVKPVEAEKPADGSGEKPADKDSK